VHPSQHYILLKKYFPYLHVSLKGSLLILFAIFILLPSETSADNPINKLSEIQEKLKTKLSEVKESKKKEESIITKIEDIDENISKKENDLRKYDNRINNKQSEIQSISKEIKILTSRLNNRKKYLKSRIRALHKQQYGGGVLVLLSAEDHHDLIRKSKYVSLLAYHDSKIVNKYSDDLKKINSKKKNLKGLYDNLKVSKKNTLKKKNALQADRSKKDDLLAVVRSERSAHEERIRELKESSRKLQSLVRDLNGNKIPKSIVGDGFKSLEGNLSWPVNGDLLIPDGKSYKFPLVKDGIEITAKPDEIVKAVAGGRVVYANFFKGYGNLIIIDHGSGYHSLYGNLTGFTIASGELLIEGMEVAKVNKSDNSDGHTLYFEIRHRGRPVDPVNWLKDQKKRNRGLSTSIR
jgi:septal ring factor EnvC (AmiA/AmiB activator)